MRVYYDHEQKLWQNSKALMGLSQVSRPSAAGVNWLCVPAQCQWLDVQGKMNQAGMRTMFGATAWAAEEKPSRATQEGQPSPQQPCRRLEPLQCQSGDADTHSG